MEGKEEQQKTEVRQPIRGLLAVLWRWIKRLSLILLFLFVALNIIIQIPAVQNWAANKITTTLSNSLQTEVSLDQLSFSFFDELELEGLLIKDLKPEDTLLYSQRLYADFDLNPFTYLWRGLVIEEIQLDQAHINIRKEAESDLSNIQIFIQRLVPPKPEPTSPKRPFVLDLELLTINKTHFLKDDQAKGQTMEAYLHKGVVDLESFDLINNYITANRVELSGPYFSIKEFSGKPGPVLEDEVAIDTGFQKPPLSIFINDFKVKDGKFSLHNYRNEPVRLAPPNELDYQHMDIYAINMQAQQFSFCEDSLDFAGRNAQISCKTASGFTLENLSANDARVWCKGVDLLGMNLKTPDSEIGDTLIFRYRGYEAWTNFQNRVNIEAHINNSAITLKDVITFVPKLKQNVFFNDNSDRKLFVNGLVTGRINRLSGDDIDIRFEDRSLIIRGDFGSRDLTIRQSELVNLNLKELTTNMPTLRQLLPSFKPPANFDNLGRLRFKGRFDGYFTDFVADGQLTSELGGAQMNMQILNLKQGRELAKYRGALKLINFDLGGWAQQPDLGKVSLSTQVSNGIGLTAESASASLSAQVDSFVYKGYKYENATLTGSLEKNLFQGDFNIEDKNIDFTFTGVVNMKDSIPTFNFSANVDRLDLQRLNLSQKNIVLAGAVDLNITNTTLAKLTGSGNIDNFSIYNRETGESKIDHISFRSLFNSDGERWFIVRSDVIEANFFGVFDIEQVPGAFMNYLHSNYTSFYNRLALKQPKNDTKRQQFNFNIDIKDTKNLLSLVEPRLQPIRGAEISGYFDNAKDSIDLSIYIPQFRFDKITLNDIAILSWLEQDEGFVDLLISQPIINKTKLSSVKLLSELNRDTVRLALAYKSEGLSLLDQLNLNARLFLPDSLNYRLEFEQSNLAIMEMPWIINEQNYITFRKGYVDTDSLMLVNQEKEIRLQTSDDEGLKLSLLNMNFDFINQIWDYEPLDFAGRFNVNAEVKNIFNMTGIKGSINADTLWINDDDWGVFSLDVNARDLKSPLNANLFITKDTTQIITKGYFNLAEIRGRGKAENKKAQYFDFDLYATSIPVAMAEYWLKGTISNTVGAFDANLNVFGLPTQPHIDGDVQVSDAAITVNFLQTRYYIDDAFVKAKDFLFDATGNSIKDKYGNVAKVTGGVTHNYLKELGINATLNTDQFLAMDTKKGDNELFYGHAIGKGQVNFTGPLNKIDIYVGATVIDGTKMVIPISYGSNTSELSYINFSKRKTEDNLAKKKEAAQALSQTGIDLEMDLGIAKEAVGEIIFDEQAGDIIKGKGRGDIRILVPRSGGFFMYGDYNIVEGDYLFTLYNVVNKKFTVKRGGVISWSGDPFEAKISLEAEYTGLSTSVANLIQEYLADQPAEVQNDALKATPVNLTMNLKGDLLKPVIDFDIDFPELIGTLETLTDSKLRVIRQDPNEFNRQVFGLIVAGQFLPSDFALQGGDIFYNTVSEFVSNQLSLLLTELFSEFFSNGSNNNLSGFDFDIAYNQYQSASIQNNSDIIRGDEFQVRLKQDFFDDRLTILIGGNVDIGNASNTTNPDATSTFVGNDLVIEYVLNDDRTMKLRIYQRLEPDIGGGSRLEVGTGLSFRKEYDSFGEFLRNIKLKGNKKSRK
jgi:hypothetical protein